MPGRYAVIIRPKVRPWAISFMFCAVALLSSCSAQLWTTRPHVFSLHLEFPIEGTGASRSIPAGRLLLPSVATVKVTMVPADSRFASRETSVAVASGSSSATASFSLVEEGVWAISAVAADGAGKAIFGQSANVDIGTATTSVTLNLVPRSSTAFPATTSDPLLATQTISASAFFSWTVPASALKTDGSFDVWLDPSASSLTTYLQFASGALMASPSLSSGSGAGSFVTVYNSGSAAATANLILNPYRISYDANGGTGTTPVDANGYMPGGSHATATISGAGALTRVNYSFYAWNTIQDGTGTSVLPGPLNPTASMKLYAQWAPIATITVGFTLSSLTPYALAFSPSVANLAQNGTQAIDCTNSTLVSGGSGWAWSIDGVPVSGANASSFTFDPAIQLVQAQRVGQHIISLKVNYSGVWYSGDLVATVTQ